MSSPESPCEAYVSAPIRLAAEISEHGDRRRRSVSGGALPKRQVFKSYFVMQASERAARPALAASLALVALALAHTCRAHQPQAQTQPQPQMQALNSQLVNQDSQGPSAAGDSAQQQLRHQAHYLNFVPSATFSYSEGRQAGARALELDGAASAPAEQAASSHMYKRSSAVLMPPLAMAAAAAAPVRPGLNPLSRRMMSAGANWLGVAHAGEQAPELASGAQEEQASASQAQQQQQAQLTLHRPEREHQERSAGAAARPADPAAQLASNQRKQAEREAELLRQKQHIQYHDQWPSMAGKCHKRTLNFCASVLPFNTTTFPNIIGDTNRFEVKRSLPFFGFLAKSSCNKRLDELLCLLLEPPCQAHSGAAIPPCKKFCRLALEGCNEYIPATLALSSVFDCRQYPDSTDPSVCVNLAQGSKCAADEFKCPDKTCIPRNWLCDGVRDCVFAADEANCTDSAASPQASVCSTEEFKCDGKCVPKAWKCDGERDCVDGSDEESCDARPRCGPDRFKCHDGNGCIPKRWVCDGKAECRDGSDEMNCEQRECSENDFKCDNGICIPKLWRCDGQFDCKDASDERQCVYPTAASTTTTTTTTTTTSTSGSSSSPTNTPTAAFTTATSTMSARTTAELLADGETLTTIAADGGVELPVNASYSIRQPVAGDLEAELQTTRANDQTEATSEQPSKQQQQQLEINLNGDISRIIQHERDTQASSTSAQPPAPQPSPMAPTSGPGDQQPAVQTTFISQEPGDGAAGANQAKEMKKFDYDLIPSSSNELPVGQQPQAPHKTQTQVDFVPSQPSQQQQQQQQQQQVRTITMGGPVALMQESDPGLAAHAQQQLHQQPAPHRVPIYRSLFKSLKGHHHLGVEPHHRALYRQQMDRNGTHRHVVAIARRRRDRHHPQEQQQQQLQQQQPRVQLLGRPPFQAALEQKQDAGQMLELVAPPRGPPLMHGQPSMMGDLQQQQQQQRARLMGPPQSQQHQHQPSHGPGPVASYLHMLNSRYNLRLPRVVGGGAAASAS